MFLSTNPLIQDFLAILGVGSPGSSCPRRDGKKNKSVRGRELLFLKNWIDFFTGVTKTERPDFDFEISIGGACEVMESLGVMNLEGFGIDVEHPVSVSAGALLLTPQMCLGVKAGKPSKD